ncbi:unnamed protein product [Lactuca saligna]|uniref:Uncharacterized protein n=1 Tax=Lactuca saligna TaxID=75948 RepID=A0AA35YIF8_LACSI|nr:unnamed protein product [Lactuca saligna]
MNCKLHPSDREVMSSDSLTSLKSSMDLTLDVSQLEGSRSIPPNLHSKVVKLDFDCGKPPIVFTRATSKGFILKSVVRVLKMINSSRCLPPKRTRSGRESRSRSLNDLFDPPAPNVTRSECTSENLNTNVFQECPIEPDSKIKCVEDEAEVSHLDKSESETVTGGLPEKIPDNPLLEKEDPKGLSVVALFHQKLFGSGHGRFMASATNSLVVISIPIPYDTIIVTTRNLFRHCNPFPLIKPFVF